jgi:hypothetical protein
MPRSGAERLLLVVGLVALAAVGLLAFRGWQRYHRTSTTVTVTTATLTRPAPARPHRRAATVTHAVAPPGALVLRAARGASWVAVRARTAAGRVLYQGILARGRAVRLRGDRFWVRAGAAANLTASFDDRPVRGFPKGTVTMSIVDGVARILG